MSQPIILAIESSCDDTSAAMIRGSQILSHTVASQEIHQKYGGVVPEWASRKHQVNIVPVVSMAIQQANIPQNQIDAIAFTRGPGLLGSLLVGVNFAKSFAMAHQIPLIEVNHMQAHILAHFISDANPTPPQFPFLCLTVSGGHTQIVKVKDYFEMEIIAETRDDAVGEAFDKIGKLLGLQYPAGPEIDRLAKIGNTNAFEFPLPKLQELAFSYSGIKTSVLYFLQKMEKENPKFIQENLYDLAASVQKTLVESLMVVLEKAVLQTSIQEVAIAGGVSANSALRQALIQKKEWNTYLPKFEYTTDNAAMIAMVGSLKFERKDFAPMSIDAQARLPI